MQKDRRIYLQWMLRSIDAIQEYAKWLDQRSFESNNLVHDACLMQFQHLGETANKLKTISHEDNSLPYREIVGFRNFIAHDYIGIELAEVWDTIEQDLPELKQKLTQLLHDT